MDRYETKARAKINLSLDVTGKRADDYHELRMIMQSISLSDDVAVELSKEIGISVCADGDFVPTDGKNLAYIAAERFFERTGIKRGAKIFLKKRIPISAGLAGGSADAAAVLRALNEMTDRMLTRAELAETALLVGSDVPFCLYGGTSLAEGRGEILTRLSPLPKCSIVLCKPPFPISTKYVFSKIDGVKTELHPDTAGIIGALKKKNLAQVARRMYNVLEQVTAQEHREINAIKSELIAGGAQGAVMSGSGPTVFGLFTSQSAAQAAANALKSDYPNTYIAFPVSEEENR